MYTTFRRAGRSCRSRLEFIKETFSRETGKRRFAYIAPKKTELLDNIAAEWESIWRKFPSTEGLSRSAIEAYAVGLNEACVYHMMMVLEPGLKALAQRLTVKYDRRAWEKIIGDIEDAIRAAVKVRGNTPKGSKPPTAVVAARRNADITLFSTAATEFVWFKEAWRNHVAHGRAKYEENDALKVITHVRGFMERLSIRLKETRR